MGTSNRKQLILEDTKKVFGQKGFFGSSSKSLAKAAGISEALLYKHFPSKEILFRAVLEFALEHYLNISIPNEQGKTNRTRNIAYAFSRLGDETLRLLVFAYLELDKKYLLNYIKKYEKEISVLYKKSKDTGQKSVDSYGKVLISALLGYNLFYSPSSPAEVVDAITNHLIKT